MFVASSREALTIAQAIRENLRHDIEISIWNEGVFDLSRTTLECLVLLLSQMDFALFVFAQDDVARLKKRQYATVRDNVLFELGLFIGRLGVRRCFILMPDKTTNFRWPSDLLGLTPAVFETDRADGNLVAAVGAACDQVRRSVRSEGPFVFRGFPVIQVGAEYRGPRLEGEWLLFNTNDSEKETEPSGRAAIVQNGANVRLSLHRTRSRSTGQPTSRRFEYFGRFDSGQLVMLFEDVEMQGYITGAVVLKISTNNRRLAGMTLYLEHDTGLVVAKDLRFERVA